jgi:hypothetical protein
MRQTRAVGFTIQMICTQWGEPLIRPSEVFQNSPKRSQISVVIWRFASFAYSTKVKERLCTSLSLLRPSLLVESGSARSTHLVLIPLLVSYSPRTLMGSL